MRLLVVEDDREARDYLLKGLKESGHVADHATDQDRPEHAALSVQVVRDGAVIAGRHGVIVSHHSLSCAEVALP